MGISIKDPKAEELAKEVARKTGESIKEAVIRSLEERLQRISQKESPPQDPQNIFKEIMKISRECSSLPDLDSRSPEEILGYDEKGRDFSQTDIPAVK